MIYIFIIDGRMRKIMENWGWTATWQKDGTWKMTITKITDEQCNALQAVFQKLNNNGFTAAVQKKREEEAKKEQGHIVK